jgi:phosphoglycolate phosphatase-like HAD superfamily hydrolase
MKVQPLLVLDFDGVICDSVEECWVSSWTAYHELFLGRAPSSPPAGPGADARLRFRALRPYVRSGEDFVLIQQLVSRGASVDSQAEFDREWEKPGAPSRRELKELYYRARTALFDRDPEAWVAMNRIFPHVPAALAGLSPRVPLYILSTKKPQFVSATLRANRLSVPESRVLYSEEEPKLSVVERLMRELPAQEAVFVEDQVDALRGNRNPRIRTFLATWGYVQAEWLRDPGPSFEPLDPQGFTRLLASL